MPNEIFNIQHTITQLQNIEKLQAVGQQREQHQQKQEAMSLQARRDMEQTIVQISEEAEKVFVRDEREKRQKEEGGNKGDKGKRSASEVEAPDDNEVRTVDIVV